MKKFLLMFLTVVLGIGFVTSNFKPASAQEEKE